jgi:salicylate hydroxylase
MKISIVGGGIGGLTLAVALHREGIPARVYERDSSPSARSQGYAISLNERTGLRVLDELGLGSKIRQLGRPAEAFTFLTSSGKQLMRLQASPGSPQSAVGIPRDLLRMSLLDEVPPGWQEWGVRVRAATENGQRVLLNSAGQSLAEADLVVAADGVGSQLRGALIGDSLNYLGLTAVGGIIDGGIDHPLLSGGAFMTMHPGSSIFVQRYSEEERTIWSICTHAAEGRFDQLSDHDLVEWAMEHVVGWHAPISDVIKKSSTNELSVRKYYDRDPLASCVRDGVVLVGDAAHPMSPFQGQGANMAMVDAFELARAIKAKLSGDRDAINRYDREATKRNRRAVMQSRMAARLFHIKGAIGIATRNLMLSASDKFMSRGA